MKKLLLILRSYFPTQLPIGMTAFNKWADDIITLTGPLADTDSIKFVLSNEIVHSGPDNYRIPMRWFVNRLKKAAAKQVASQAFMDVKTRQAEAQAKAKADAEAAKLSQPADTGTPTVVPDVPTPN